MLKYVYIDQKPTSVSMLTFSGCINRDEIYNAVANGISIEKRTPGDADGDGELTIRDVSLIKQYIAKWNVTINEKNADVNGDGDVNVKDVTLISQKLANWNVTLV